MDASSLKVLLFAGRFQIRGTSAYTLRLAKHLPEHGIDVRIVCPDAHLVDPGRRKELKIIEYTHLDLPIWGRVILEALRRELATDPPDLIHIQSWGMLSHGIWLARKLKRPFVLTVHDYIQGRQRHRFDKTWGRRIIGVSQSVKSELLQQLPVPEDLVTVIHGGVEASTKVDAPPVLDPGHVPVVGTAGPLEAVKGLPFFLGAAQKVLAADSNVEFLISGAGPEESNLRRMAHDLNISEHVTFVPNLHDFSVSLSAMDIFCLPSLRQGLGTIMLEAMALGKPVIATGVGGVYSVIHDQENGLVVPPSDSGQLAEKILELLVDPVRARAIGDAGRRMVNREFVVEKMVRQTADLYREVLAEAETDRPVSLS